MNMWLGVATADADAAQPTSIFFRTTRRGGGSISNGIARIKVDGCFSLCVDCDKCPYDDGSQITPFTAGYLPSELMCARGWSASQAEPDHIPWLT